MHACTSTLYTRRVNFPIKRKYKHYFFFVFSHIDLFSLCHRWEHTGRIPPCVKMTQKKNGNRKCIYGGFDNDGIFTFREKRMFWITMNNR